MRKITVLSFISLDGVIQSPGSPQEDPSGNFTYGGWVSPFDKDLEGKFMQNLLLPSDLLLGRTTFDIWAEYWPKNADNWKGINEVTKYVLSTTKKKSDWSNSVFLENVSDIKDLKNSEGSNLKVWGSSKLVQLLLENDLVDELWLLMCPVTLGKGKKLFGQGLTPTSYELAESFVTSRGILVSNFKRAGKVRTATIGK